MTIYRDFNGLKIAQTKSQITPNTYLASDSLASASFARMKQ